MKINTGLNSDYRQMKSMIDEVVEEYMDYLENLKEYCKIDNEKFVEEMKYLKKVIQKERQNLVNEYEN